MNLALTKGNINKLTKTFKTKGLQADSVLGYSAVDDVNAEVIYESLFNMIPSVIHVYSLSFEAEAVLVNDLKAQLFAFCVGHVVNPDDSNCSEVRFYLIEACSEILVKVRKGTDTISAVVCGVNSEALHKIADALAKKKAPEKESKIGILASNGDSTYIKHLEIDVPKMNIELNYGKSFGVIHKAIEDRLQAKKNGLFLFHGDVGTGKTTYIKHLAKQVNDRLFIFIPTALIESLINPSLIGLLIDQKNAVLVLEDAEKAVVSREESGDGSLVSTILNLSDGILGSILNTAIIVTFNTARQQIDKALLRPGRLIAEHKFDKLNVIDARNLAKHLNKDAVNLDITIQNDMSLAEIYNLSIDNFHREKQAGSIGFSK